MRSLPSVLAGAVIAIAAFLLGARAIYEPDLWWHLAQGREDLAGRIVRTNLFSATAPDFPQHYTAWWFDATAYVAWMAGGAAGVQAFQILLLAATFGLIYVAAKHAALRWPVPAGATIPPSIAPASASLAAVSILLLAIVVIEPRAIPRPHLVSFAGMAAISFLMTRAIAGRRAAPLRLAVPIMAIWGNFHSEAILGAAVVALFAVAEFVRPAALDRREAWRALIVAALCGLATMATPYGWGAIHYLFDNLWVPTTLEIAELAPPYLPGYRAFYVYLAVWVVIMLSQPKQLRLWEVVVGLAAAALGLRFIRLTPLVVILTAPMLASRAAVFIAHGLDARAMLATTIVAVALVSRIPLPTLASTWRIGGDAIAPAGFFSTRAVDFARAEGLDGPLFNSNNLGGFLAWSLFPPPRTFQDSRLQAYPREHWLAIQRAERSPAAWEQLVAGVDWAMVSVARPVALSGSGMFSRTTWSTVFWDDAVEILVRRSGAHAGLAAAREYTMLTPGTDALALAAHLSTERRDRLLLEAARNALDNPDGFTPVAVLCLGGDEVACTRLDSIASRRPSSGEDARRIRAARSRR